MRHLFYAGNSIQLADLTCKALLRYARALANAEKCDIVTIPVINEGGSIGSAHLLLGPSSQLFSTHVPDSSDEPIDRDAIAEMERLTARLGPDTPAWPLEMTDIPDLDFPVDYTYD
jgi:hypothetical protein